MSDPIDVETQTEPQQLPLAKASAADAIRALEPVKPPVTAAQAKTEAVANLTASAYARASELRLTPEESAALQAPFNDEDFRRGAAGKENLIYIQHSALRDRFNRVLGLGQWALIPRSRWAEDYEYYDKDTRTQQRASRVYVEAMLMIRGCFVAEAIGDMTYYPKNQATNYGDAVEGATTQAFRRCAKMFGVGLQAWDKAWTDGWWERQKGQSRKTPPPAAQAAPRQAASPPPSTSTPKPAQRSIGPTEAHRDRVIELLSAEDLLNEGREFFEKVGGLLPNEGLIDLPLHFVPATKEQMDALLTAIGAFAHGDEARLPYPKQEIADKPKPKAKEPEAPIGSRVAETYDSDPEDPNAEDAAWRSFPMPWGKEAGTPLAELDKKYLYGLWANYEVETEYNGKPKRPEAIAKDQKFRDMLNDAGEHYQFTKKD